MGGGGGGGELKDSELASAMLTSASTYCRPFCRTAMSAPGGMEEPLMLDWWTCASRPNVNAEC